MLKLYLNVMFWPQCLFNFSFFLSLIADVLWRTQKNVLFRLKFIFKIFFSKAILCSFYLLFEKLARNESEYHWSLPIARNTIKLTIIVKNSIFFCWILMAFHDTKNWHPLHFHSWLLLPLPLFFYFLAFSA